MPPFLPLIVVSVTSGANTRHLNESGGTARADGTNYSSVIPGGYDQLSTRIPKSEMDSFASVYVYGARVTARIGSSSGTVVWEGYLKRPVPSPEQTVTLEAAGWKTLVEERETPLLWQTRSYGDWSSGEDDPFSFNNDDDISELLRGGSVGFRVAKGSKVNGSTSQGVSNGSRARICWWPDQAVRVKRVAGRVHQNTASVGDNYGMRLEAYNGPWESATSQTSYASLSSAIASPGATTFDTGTVANAKAMLAFAIWRSGNSTTALNQTFKVWVTELRVNGDAYRATPASWDSYVASEMVKDIASKAGSFLASSMVQTTTPNMLPLWWASGTWSDAMDYLAEASAYKWAVWQGPEVEFRDWSTGNTTWTTNAYGSTATAIADIVPSDDIYTKVQVIYRIQGNPRQRTYTRDTGQLTGFNPPRDRTYVFRIEDPLPIGSSGNNGHPQLALDIGSALATEFSAERYAGSLFTSFLTDSGSVQREAARVRAGQLVTVSDFPGGAKTFRIYETEYDSESGLTMNLARQPSSVDRLLIWEEKRRMRSGRISSSPA